MLRGNIVIPSCARPILYLTEDGTRISKRGDFVEIAECKCYPKLALQLR